MQCRSSWTGRPPQQPEASATALLAVVQRVVRSFTAVPASRSSRQPAPCSGGAGTPIRNLGSDVSGYPEPASAAYRTRHPFASAPTRLRVAVDLNRKVCYARIRYRRKMSQLPSLTVIRARRGSPESREVESNDVNLLRHACEHLCPRTSAVQPIVASCQFVGKSSKST
jgi:hypothetical protein